MPLLDPARLTPGRKLRSFPGEFVSLFQISLADISVFHWANLYMDSPKLPPGNGFNVADYGNVAKLVARVAAEPNIAKYLGEKKAKKATAGN